MKDENLIHIRLNHSEAVNAKVDVLSTQMNLIKMIKIMKVFHKLRSEELKTKLKIQKKLKDLDKDVHKLETLLPKIHIPKILKHEEEEIIEKPAVVKKTEKKKERDPKDIDLERQLKEIQDKLRMLE
jgi:histidyl-tRNA synthetase